MRSLHRVALITVWIVGTAGFACFSLYSLWKAFTDIETARAHWLEGGLIAAIFSLVAFFLFRSRIRSASEQ